MKLSGNIRSVTANLGAVSNIVMNYMRFGKDSAWSNTKIKTSILTHKRFLMTSDASERSLPYVAWELYTSLGLCFNTDL